MIEFKNITKHFLTKKNSVHALNDVSFQIDDGEIFGIVGFSGAGKSTLVRMINGLEKPSSGQVLVDGNDPGKLNKKELRSMRKKKMCIRDRMIQNAMLAVYNYLQEQNTLQNMAFSYTANAKGEVYAIVSEMQETKDGNTVDVRYLSLIHI